MGPRKSPQPPRVAVTLVATATALVVGAALVAAGPVAAATSATNPTHMTSDPIPGDADPADFPVVTPEGHDGLKAAEVTDAVALFSELNARGRGGEWYLGYDNEGGALAWGESFVLAALIEMYRATGDVGYLDQFVRHADGVLAQTDESRRVTDWDGNSGPVWRAGSRYNYASLVATATDGQPFGVLVATSRLYNDKTQAEIRPGSALRTFYLSVRNAVYKRAEGYDRLTNDPRSPNWWVERVNSRSTLVRVSAHRLGEKVLPAPMPRRYFQQSFVVHAAHTGLLVYPLARFFRLVSEEPSLAPAFGADAARYLTAAERAVSFHDDEWVSSPISGYYRFQRGAPVWCDGVGLPHNQNVAMGRALLELARATGRRTYRDRAERIARRLELELALTHRRGYAWRYWWGRGLSGWNRRNTPSLNTPSYTGYRAYEDIMHAAYDVDFVADAAEAGVVFEARDAARMANTLLLNMRRVADYHNRVNGTTVGSMRGDAARAARWMTLAAVSRDLYDQTTPGLTEALLDGDVYGSKLYTAAVLARVQAGYSQEASGTGQPSGAARAPAVLLLSPAGRRVGGLVEVSAKITTPVATSALFVGGRAPVSSRRVGFGQWVLDTHALPDGAMRFEVVAADAIDRAGVAARIVDVDNSPPRVSWTRAPRQLTPNADGDRDRDWWVFWASEPGLRQVVLTTRSGAVAAVPLVFAARPAGRTGVLLDGTRLGGRAPKDGTYLIRAFAKDDLGNIRALPPRPLLVSRVARWKAPAGQKIVLRAGVTGVVLVPVNLRRRAVVSAGLYRGSARIQGVWGEAPARAGWLVLTISRRGPRGRLPPGRYSLIVRARDRLGTVTLSRAVEVS